jgi:hypothetical protein
MHSDAADKFIAIGRKPSLRNPAAGAATGLFNQSLALLFNRLVQSVLTQQKRNTKVGLEVDLHQKQILRQNLYEFPYLNHS